MEKLTDAELYDVEEAIRDGCSEELASKFNRIFTELKEIAWRYEELCK